MLYILGNNLYGGIMIKIGICDDDKVILNYEYGKVKHITDKLRKDVYIKKFHHGNDIICEGINEANDFDILFLDIDMPGLNGFEIAEGIRKFNDNLIIIFLTSMEELVYGSFKYNPFRFIRKQNLDDELTEVLRSAIKVIESRTLHQYIFKTEGGYVKFSLDDILYVKCINRKVYIKTKARQFALIGVKFKDVVKCFLDKDFVMVHRSCVVNIKYFFSIDKEDITLDNGEKLQMSRYKVNDVKKAFMMYAGETI